MGWVMASNICKWHTKSPILVKGNLTIFGPVIYIKVSSGFFLGCKIRDADFCSMHKFSLTMQKILMPISLFFQKLWISNIM